jgi:hypothetical protein
LSNNARNYNPAFVSSRLQHISTIQLKIYMLNYMKINNPINIIVPAIFPFAGNFVGVKTTIKGSVFNTHAHCGRDVLPDTTIINNVTTKAANPK